jgi:hypothetical protein
MVKGQRLSLAGTIIYFSRDNLGSQLIGGFKEGSGAHLKCRHCMGNANLITTKVGMLFGYILVYITFFYLLTL